MEEAPYRTFTMVKYWISLPIPNKFGVVILTKVTFLSFLVINRMSKLIY